MTGYEPQFFLNLQIKNCILYNCYQLRSILTRIDSDSTWISTWSLA